MHQFQWILWGKCASGAAPIITSFNSIVATMATHNRRLKVHDLECDPIVALSF